ncbi:MAG: hypothetical protein DRP08_07440 [Candidatus Aenigmatarchaeota archaeon]|nr:MAG: hypothetical protein DRP08_07440 [Candidatus Aenigmarchaeota archaeon]
MAGCVGGSFGSTRGADEIRCACCEGSGGDFGNCGCIF